MIGVKIAITALFVGVPSAIWLAHLVQMGGKRHWSARVTALCVVVCAVLLVGGMLFQLWSLP